MMHIVVFLFLKTGAVGYVLPKEYGQRWECDEAIERIKEDWKTKKHVGVQYKCAFFLRV